MCVCVCVCACACVHAYKKIQGQGVGEEDTRHRPYAFICPYSECVLASIWGALHIAGSIVTDSSEVTALHLAIQGGNYFFI